MSSKKQKIWVLTAEYNDYDQYGEYFVRAFKSKPTIEEILKATEKDETVYNVRTLLEFCLHVQNGGGRQDTEDSWYNLNEEVI